MDAFKAYVAVAGLCATACVLVVLIVVRTYDRISDQGLWRLAAMTFATAALGFGVSYFINRTASGGEPKWPKGS